MEALTTYLPFIIQLPLIIVWIFGIILATKIKEQNPRVAKLTAAGLSVAVIGVVVVFVVHTNILTQYVFGNIDAETLNTSNTVILIAETLTYLTTFILLLMAIFKPSSTKSKNNEQ